MRKLNEKERTWINLMLEPEFFGKKELLDQVKHSLVEANYNKGFYFSEICYPAQY